MLEVEEILGAGEPETDGGVEIGRSREGRPIRAWRLGEGRHRVSLIGGCHADEPVGPDMLRRLVAWLERRPATHPARTRVAWRVVPHVNPDGAHRNRAWVRETVPVADSAGQADRGFDLPAYLAHVVREPPGEDVEFGFPREAGDAGARPENLAVAGFLRGAPFALHASFHGMAFAPGPWFLIERAWIDRTGAMREALRRRVAEMGYRPADLDRRGEKGFERIDEGFSTRPDSRAMAAHFEGLGDPETARLFRPSSMEHVRALGGDPLTFVSEVPLFLLPDGGEAPAVGRDAGGRRRFKAWLQDLAAGRSAAEVRRQAERLGIRPMPLRDQMRLQLAFLAEGLAAAGVAEP